MNCDDYQKNFSKLMDNELSEAYCATLFTHMGTCPICREFFRTSMQIQSALDEIRVPEPNGLAALRPFGAQVPVQARLAPSLFQRLRETKISLSFAAAAVVLVMAGTLALSSLWMRPYEIKPQPAERIVYSFLLPPVNVEPPVPQKHPSN
jgi:hypothetical protein